MPAPISLSALAQRVNCSKYPERWNTLFPEVMAQFDAEGCIYTDPGYYAQLNRRYGILTDVLPLYQQAAVETAKDEDLSRFLALLCRALQDREHHKEDMASFSCPRKPGCLAYDMVTGLAAASQAPMCLEILRSRNIPQDMIDHIMKMPEFGVQFYKLRHDGAPGYNLLEWFQLAIDGKLFRIGRLEYELFASFSGRACVFENGQGDRIALAHDLPLHVTGNALGSRGYEEEAGSWTAMISETETHWVGHPVRSDGTVSKETLALSKDLWRMILSKGDPVISVHIPAGGGLTPTLVDESFRDAKAFFARYFPDYAYKAFVCYSWLMDPQLVDLLGADTNIAKFNLRFTKLVRKSSGGGVFSFIYLKPDTDLDIQSLPERTTLERKIKQHYLDGNCIYEQIGYFFDT